MLRIILLFILLFTTWVIFSGFIDIFFLSLGAISCSIAVYFSHKMSLLNGTSDKIRFKITAPLYILWLFKEVLYSSIQVSLVIWQLSPKISPALGVVRTAQKSSVGKTVFANSITLTPGTVCIDVDGKDIIVYALQEESLNNLSSSMDKVITKMI